MSAFLHDLPANASFATLIPPSSATTSGVGSTVASLSGEGQEFALVQIGTPSSGATLTVSIEESNDQSTWTAISGATTGAKNAATVLALTFTRSQSYVRARTVVTGSSPSIPVAVAIGQQRKLW
jgi:hypothetical protein